VVLSLASTALWLTESLNRAVLHEQHEPRPHTITGHQNLKEIATHTKAVEQAALAKTAVASVMKAFHEAEVANPYVGLAEIDFNVLILEDQNTQVALPRGLEPPPQSA
jgi:hypothetical protein